MDKLYDLKERLCKELESYAGKDLNASSLDIVMKLAGAVKNLGKIIRMCEEDDGGYSGRGYVYGHNPMGRDVERGSYARGRRGAPRDSMGRYSGEMGYSRHNDPASELRELMAHAPDEQTRRELEEIARRMER